MSCNIIVICFSRRSVSNVNFLDISLNSDSINATSWCFTTNYDMSNDYVVDFREESFNMQTETQKFESEYEEIFDHFVKLYLIIYVGIISSFKIKDMNLSLSTSFAESFHAKERDDRQNLDVGYKHHTIETSSEIQHINSIHLDVSLCSNNSAILCSPVTNTDSSLDFQTPSKGLVFFLNELFFRCIQW